MFIEINVTVKDLKSGFMIMFNKIKIHNTLPIEPCVVERESTFFLI